MTTEGAEAVRQLLRKDMQREHALHADLLQYIGLREEDLSSASQKHIRLMAQAASVLELNTTDASAYVAAISDLREKYDGLRASVSTWQRHEAKQLKRKQELHDELREMEHMLAMLDAASKERDAIENVATMDSRLKEYAGKHAVYSKEIAKLDKILADRGYFDVASYARANEIARKLNAEHARRSLQHHVLVGLEQQCAQLEADNKKVRAKVDRFQGLPPNLELANATLYKAQERLQQLEAEFQSRVHSMV
ncbi:hypothetical protein SPRG_16572 [Saprolegnia parasitica CBS 223.65]|uniref:Uncharacterized protein n=1 Tax=Saprolegnia parasitica (strain CBS 223.65) TaxID=695850 RepID=A0A067BIP1_SAPPC|nr:hypothetical protein SPRG_16572 [Saprolegnia parasitica CBS 223.65]KDO18048.1 hypothetical protein SPRG_16572 [Saprolegnia parasitica CBS 223.65]|eukprot:XP_012211240.1 hypothetical protein SPRG_16572 [Saprolegnia parasitica CBS 223.65]